SIQLRPTGIHTHFPYTTLFRSLEQLLTVGDGLVENALKHGWYGRHSESPVLRRGRGRARWRNAAGDGGSLFHLRAVRGQVRSVSRVGEPDPPFPVRWHSRRNQHPGPVIRGPGGAAPRFPSVALRYRPL